MEQIPAKIQAPYELLLFDRAIPRMDHPFYKKWLQYYLCPIYGRILIIYYLLRINFI